MTTFNRALAQWKEISLTNLQSSLDATSLQLLDSQKEAVQSRKDLASKTKEWRRQTDEARLEGMKGLLKDYQSEVDLLTSRHKDAVSAFLQVYSPLSEAADPYPILEAALDSVGAAQTLDEVTQEKVELQKREAADKQTIEQLRGKVLAMETKLQSDQRQREAIEHEQLRNSKSREEELELTIQELRATITDMRTSSDSTTKRLLSHEKTIDEGTLAKMQEGQILTRELERARSRIADLSARNEDLAKKAGTIVDVDHVRQEYEIDISRLQASLDTQTQEYTRVREESEKRVRALEHETAIGNEELNLAKEKFSRYADYEEIRRDLQILKSIEFDTESADGEGRAPESGEQKLENLLVERNKKLVNDSTLLRVRNNELQDSLEKLQQDLQSTRHELTSAKQLSVQLENDLVKLNSTSFDASSIAPSTAPTRYSRFTRTGSPTSSIIAGNAAREDVKADSSILGIVTQQRDRFRARTAELEDQLSKLRHEMGMLQAQLEKLQADNMALYQKSRYVETYTPDHYRSAYESSLSPFASFRGKEHNRIMSRLGPGDRTVLALSKFVLATKLGRNLFLVYCICLHILVIWVCLAQAGPVTKQGDWVEQPSPAERAG